MDEIVKVCKVHGGLTIDKCYSQKKYRKNKEGKYIFNGEIFLTCHECYLIYTRRKAKNYRIKNREIINEKRKIYVKENKHIYKKSNHDFYVRNKEDHYKRTKEYREKNPEKCLISQRKKHESHRKNLSDCYIRKLLFSGTGISLKYIPKELIELKRQQLFLDREIKGVLNDKQNK